MVVGREQARSQPEQDQGARLAAGKLEGEDRVRIARRPRWRGCGELASLVESVGVRQPRRAPPAARRRQCVERRESSAVLMRPHSGGSPTTMSAAAEPVVRRPGPPGAAQSASSPPPNVPSMSFCVNSKLVTALHEPAQPSRREECEQEEDGGEKAHHAAESDPIRPGRECSDHSSEAQRQASRACRRRPPDAPVAPSQPAARLRSEVDRGHEVGHHEDDDAREEEQGHLSHGQHQERKGGRPERGRRRAYRRRDRVEPVRQPQGEDRLGQQQRERRRRSPVRKRPRTAAPTPASRKSIASEPKISITSRLSASRRRR